MGNVSTESKVISSGALLAAAAAATSGPALAADLVPVKAQTAPATWDGIYVGGSLGVSWLGSVHDDSAFDFSAGYAGAPGTGTRSTANGVGWLAGLQAGVNWQSRNFVFGVEGDLTWLGDTKTQSRGQSTASFSSYYGTYTTTGASTRTSKIDALATLRARFGIDFSGTMPYLTLGVALGRIENTYSLTTAGYAGAYSASASKKEWVPGLAVGGGLEHKFGSNWSLRGEVLWVKFKDTDLSVVNALSSYTGSTASGTVKFQNELLLGKIGMNYRF